MTRTPTGVSLTQRRCVQRGDFGVFWRRLEAPVLRRRTRHCWADRSSCPRRCIRAPAGDPRRARVLVGSEADLIVAIDQFGRIALGGFRAAEEVDLLGDDLAAVAVDARRIGPLRVVDAALDEDLHALLAVLGDRLAEPVEAGDAVPFGVHHAVAVLVADRAAFREAGARGGEGEVGDLRAALGGASLRGLTDVAGEDDDVLHGGSPDFR